ncbi:MAG TPA: alkaline phosphatase family protein [Cytophaga sp.]|jgi:phospholipase C|nr:alkaline phosphatase family protein [Cytophaga sp.]
MKHHLQLFKISPAITSGVLFLGFSILLGSCKKKSDDTPATSHDINQVKHVVVIYMENHSFDNLYGEFAGANGLYNAASANMIQTDSNNNVYAHLPVVIGSPNASAFPTNLANKYFNIDQYVPAGQETPDVLHRYYQEQMQINGGKMDKYAVYNSNSKGLSQGYYQTSLLPMLPFAQKYVLCDNFFHSAFGGSFLNHMWLIAAASPTFPGAPSSIVATLDANGHPITDGAVTPDGYVVNTSYTVNNPHPASANSSTLVPNQTIPTIGDRLNDKGVTWAWYSGGWNDALQGNPASTFQYHHQPFAYFTNYADGTQAKADHLKDEMEFMNAANNGTLPAVSFVKPLGAQNEHPGYSNVIDGENHAVALINAVLNGPNGKDAVIIITYDENGGFWDHVAPPVIDNWGPGTRVPAIIVSPFSKTSYIDHTQYETLSILSFIEKRWGLNPLNDRDRNANPFSNAFNF